jgi:hypothetical protein
MPPARSASAPRGCAWRCSSSSIAGSRPNTRAWSASTPGCGCSTRAGSRTGSATSIGANAGLAFKGGVGAVAGRALGHAGADAKAIGSRINWQGWLGLIAAAVLGVMLIVQKGETRHWRKQSGQFETLYHNEQTAFAQTVANYRTAAEEARRKDAANKVRVEAEQSAISERTSHDFEIRIADARARARRLQPAQGAADPGGGRATALPGVRAAAGGAAEASGEGRLPASDALTATEQAIQLDELIKWTQRQHAIDVNAEPAH